MRRNDYLSEISISGTQRRGGNNTQSEVKKIQEWLTIHGYAHPSWGTVTQIDGDFGPATERAVMNFQRRKGLARTGVVTPSVFEKLSEPMRNAFEYSAQSPTLRKTIEKVATQHLNAGAREIYYNNNGNMGPWVRSYMKGHQGSSYAWCAGFVCTVLDQAFAIHNMPASDYIPYTWNCDVMANYAKNENSFIKYENYRPHASQVNPGDIFLIRKNSRDWIHTGFVIGVNKRTGVFTTIEGNTNENGSANGYGVLKRVRNFNRQKLDIFSMKKWAHDRILPNLATVKLHSRGAAVRFLEEELYKKGYNDVFVSDYFGVSTDVAVKDFQRKKGLTVDGVVGPVTWSVILD